MPIKLPIIIILQVQHNKTITRINNGTEVVKPDKRFKKSTQTHTME